MTNFDTFSPFGITKQIVKINNMCKFDKKCRYFTYLLIMKTTVKYTLSIKNRHLIPFSSKSNKNIAIE